MVGVFIATTATETTHGRLHAIATAIAAAANCEATLPSEQMQGGFSLLL